jgi:hypothetical protein
MSNEELKEELINMGWKKIGMSMSKKINNFDFWVSYDCLTVDNLDTDVSFIIHNITIDRIKALVYGLTGEKI